MHINNCTRDSEKNAPLPAGGGAVDGGDACGGGLEILEGGGRAAVLTPAAVLPDAGRKSVAVTR